MNTNELEYGVLYVFTNLFAPKELLDDYILSAGRACGQTEALRRFEMKVVYVDQSPALVARRFNAGNIGKTAVLTCPVCGDITIDGKLVGEFVRHLFDFNSLDDGDLHINLDDFVKGKSRREWNDRLQSPDLAQKLDNARLFAQDTQAMLPVDATADPEERDLTEAERLREQYLRIVGQVVINYVSLTHADPHPLLGDTLASTNIVLAPKGLSPLVIDSDLHIRLTDYDNAEIRLHTLSKALYILFLCHPEGIRLIDIDRHRQELQDIYEVIMPQRDDDASTSIIDNVVNPLSGTLNQNISRIKRFFKTVIMDDAVARQYYITGERGEAYGIALPRRLVTIPKVFTEKF